MTTVAIAIPTHNRARALGETLQSVFALTIPPGVEPECIVIDNASTDDTAAVAESAARGATMPMRRVLEPRLGSSFARNRALDESRAEFILFIDDDAIADREWMAEMLDAIRTRALDVGCGMVLPRWSAEPPGWLGPRLWVKLAVHSRDAIAAAPERVETLENYFSANVGFRRTAFERFGRFREDLGVVGGNPMSGEDTELFARVIDNGGKVGFVGRAIVHHLVEPDRMTRPYLLRKSFAFGVGTAVAGLPSHNRPDKLIRNSVRMLRALLRRDPEGAMYHRMECANFFGYWYGRIVAQRRLASERRSG